MLVDIHLLLVFKFVKHVHVDIGFRFELGILDVNILDAGLQLFHYFVIAKNGHEVVHTRRLIVLDHQGHTVNSENTCLSIAVVVKQTVNQFS